MKMKTCKQCLAKFEPARPLQVCCSPDCAYDYGRKQTVLKSVKEAISERKVARTKREAMRTRSEWIKIAQKAFNAFVRERDQAAGYPCISSGRQLDWSGNAVDAGHYRSVGSAPHLRFHEDNCHAQSKHDNQWKSGNAVDYRINLIQRIGLERVEALEADNEPRKYSIDDLKEIIATYRKKAKELRK